MTRGESLANKYPDTGWVYLEITIYKKIKIKHLQEEKTHFTQTKCQTQALELILVHSFVWP